MFPQEDINLEPIRMEEVDKLKEELQTLKKQFVQLQKAFLLQQRELNVLQMEKVMSAEAEFVGKGG
jgi:hypothetical protein